MATMMIRMFFESLAWTQLIESLVAALSGVRMPGMRVVWLTNLLTNPAAVCAIWLLGLRFPAAHPLVCQLPVELVVVLVEMRIYREFAKEQRWGIRHPAGLALTANAVSWVIGCLLQIVCG